MASWSRSFGFGRPTRPQEVPKGAPKGPQEGTPEGGKTGYEIGLELESLLGLILDPFGSSFWCYLGAILRTFSCPHGPLGANLLVFYRRERHSEHDFDHMRKSLKSSPSSGALELIDMTINTSNASTRRSYHVTILFAWQYSR